jgi:hypothetical protein
MEGPGTGHWQDRTTMLGRQFVTLKPNIPRTGWHLPEGLDGNIGLVMKILLSDMFIFL